VVFLFNLSFWMMIRTLHKIKSGVLKGYTLESFFHSYTWIIYVIIIIINILILDFINMI